MCVENEEQNSDSERALLDRLDSGIRETVRILRENGIETTESCEGMPGHCYAEPTVEFCGTYEAGFRALALCYAYGLKVSRLERVWSVEHGEPVGPVWRLIFYHPNGGGPHAVKQKDGFFKFQWGPIPSKETGP